VDSTQLQSLLNLLAMVLIPLSVSGAGFIAIREATQRAQRRSRLSTGPSAGAAAPDPAVSLFAGAIAGVRQVGDRIAIQDPARLSALRTKLMQAGFFSREAVAFYLGARVVALGLATCATLLTVPFATAHSGGLGATLAGGLFAAAALLGPEQVLKARTADREREYREGFPDLLDLLVASVEAGLSMDAAVVRITGELSRRYPRLAEHLRLLNLELRAGRSRREVWGRLGERLGIDEAQSFATMLRQSEEMGTSLGDTLRVFADEMRTKRMMRAEEKALALPAKLTVPLILFIFPCLLGVLILPAAFRVSQVLGKH
jgi:tight adherence protein C